MNNVILVDPSDKQIGISEKLEAHKKGLLHRAFSVFLFNNQNQLLLQRRAEEKYHSAGLWTNTCCSHPSPGEFLIKSAQNRLKEEMGISTSLTPLFSFIYRAEFDNGLIEHELDHVFIGTFNAAPLPNPNEVGEWKYASIEEIKKEIEQDPESYTFWFKLIYERVFNYISNNKK